MRFTNCSIVILSEAKDLHFPGKKWLSYRESRILGRPLTPDEVRYVSEVVRRIASILLLGPELDMSYRACAVSDSGTVAT